MFKELIVVSLILFSAVAMGYAQNKCIYTSLGEDKCRIAGDKRIPGNMSGECLGAGGYRLKMYSDDDRMSVSVISAARKVFDLDFWGYFSDFSYVGKQAEWRMRGATPVGLIVRYDVLKPGDDNKTTSYLMVSKITAAKSCVVAIVKPGQNQNEEARRLADKAANKSCKKSE